MTEAKQLVSLCTENHLTISSCESLTAGLFTSTIASIPGASAILKGGLVTYFTPMKSVPMPWPKTQEKLWMWIIVCLLRATQVRVPGKKNQQEESIVLLLLKKRFVYMVFNVQVYLEMM